MLWNQNNASITFLKYVRKLLIQLNQITAGTNGMGQAQSQSVPIDCSRCFRDRYQDQGLLYGSQSPERLTTPDQSALRPGHRF